MNEILQKLRRLNRIEYLLNTIEYSPGVPIKKWYEIRSKISDELEQAGFEVQVAEVSIGDESEDRYVLFVKGMEEGYPENWKDVAA